MKCNSARRESFRRFWLALTRRKIVVVCLFIILFFTLVAIFADVIAPYDPNKQDLFNVSAGISAEHWLGTDSLGRDTVSRLIAGTRVSMAVGLASIFLAGAVGMLIGLVIGYVGGPLDMIVMRIADAQMAIPPLIQAMALGAVMKGGFFTVVISIAVSTLPTYIRLMRGQVLAVKEQEYIRSSIAVGCKTPRLLLTHVFPNCLNPLIVLITQNLGAAILTEANLSFLGLGIAPPQASWGGMVSMGYDQLLHHPELALSPGICVILLVLAFNMVGDGLRDALDPRLRGVK